MVGVEELFFLTQKTFYAIAFSRKQYKNTKAWLDS